MNIIPAQFPAQHHPSQTHGSAEQHAGQGVDAHLRRAVDGNVGRNLPAQLNHRQILYDEGIHIADSGAANQIADLPHFPVGNQGVQGQVHRNTANMTVLYCLGEHLRCEIFCTLTGIKAAAA